MLQGTQHAAFLLLNAILGVQRGIMAKPAPVIFRFATVEAFGRTLVIATVVLIGARRAARAASFRSARLPLVAPAPRGVYYSRRSPSQRNSAGRSFKAKRRERERP